MSHVELFADACGFDVTDVLPNILAQTSLSVALSASLLKVTCLELIDVMTTSHDYKVFLKTVMTQYLDKYVTNDRLDHSTAITNITIDLYFAP